MLLYFSIFILSNIILTNQACEPRVNHCLKCHPLTQLCIKCELDIYSPDLEGGCQNSKKCIYGHNHCMQCDENEKLCKECDIGYFPDENGGCSLTENCIISYKGECLQCKDNYILIGSRNYYGNDPIQLCKPKNSDDLLHCGYFSNDKGICQECEEGYYLTSSDKKCTKVENCSHAYFGACSRCKYNHYLDKKQQKCLVQEGKFINCRVSNDGTKCDECIDDYYFDKEGKCVISNYCELGEPYKCLKCIDNYYISSYIGICTTTEHCYSGRRDIGICTQCEENYCIDFKDGKCKSNQEDNDYFNCRVAEGKCTQCDYGAYLGDDQKCSNTPNCGKSEKGKCVKCSDNSYLGLDNKCSRVKHCIYSDSYFNCIECETNYYYNTKSQTCNISEGIYENCQYGNEDKCQKCKDGFYLNKTDYLCYSGKESGSYYKCLESNNNACTLCMEGYFLGQIDHRCTKAEYCDIIENENRCKVCSETYCLNAKTGFCEDNDVIEYIEKKFFFRCNVTNAEATACERCLEGYYLKDGLCLDDLHCSEKNDDGTCKRCQRFDDEPWEQCLSDTFECIEAYYDPNCLKCDNITSVGDCTMCIEGYELDRYNNCVEKD